jgi:hypothetical protein
MLTLASTCGAKLRLKPHLAQGYAFLQRHFMVLVTVVLYSLSPREETGEQQMMYNTSSQATCGGENSSFSTQITFVKELLPFRF